MVSFFDIALIVFGTLATGSIGYLWINSGTQPASPIEHAETSEVCYLFDKGVLQHATEATEDFYPLDPGLHEWSDLHEKLVEKFTDFPARPRLHGAGEITLSAEDIEGTEKISISWDSGFSRVKLVSSIRKPQAAETGDQSLLRRISTSLTSPVWQTDLDGTLLWCNRVYKDLNRLAYPDKSFEDQPLFNPALTATSQRVSLRDTATNRKDWYEVSRTQVDDIYCYQGTCISALVHAEEAQRNFVQTLTKTFAQLSIGLAIFDRKNQLALFNPALVDLTGLRAEFLSARPTLQTFFDRLRETRRMPEPKNYANWRTAIAELISAANDGRYEETWSLDSGQTFRVKGRPHPDGATAFLIEDISAEVSLTRNFRAELELGQSMLDTLDDGIAVFSGSGILTFSNAAYQKLWNVDPESSFADMTIYDAILDWKRKSAPNLMWQEIEDFVRNLGDRQPWSMPLYLSQGARLTCLISPIVAGATLIRFHVVKKIESDDIQITPEQEPLGT